MMLVAQVGPFTAVVEAMAAAIGAGIVLGSFAIGTVRFLGGQSRHALEAHVLTDGYLGGLIGASVVVVDLVLRYGGLK